MSSLYEFDTNRVAGSGNFSKGTAGQALGDRKVCYMGADGLWYLADADAVATMPVLGLTIGSITSGRKGVFLLYGYVGLSTWTWTLGGELYASATAGEISQTPPVVGTIQVVGWANLATQMFFNPKAVGGGGVGCALLEGATAYVGFDECKEPYANYFLCDGTADDVQVQAAFDYLGALGGGELHMESGDYAFAAMVAVPYSDLLVRGSGKSTVITYLGNVHALQFLHTSELHNIEVRDIKFVGNPADDENELLVFDYVNNFRVENCLFEDSGDEALVIAMGNGVCRNGVIRNNHFVDCSSVDAAGAAINLQCGYHLIEGNLIEGGIGFGIHLEAIGGTEKIENVSIINNKLNVPAASIGILLNVTAFDIENCIISENEVYGPTVGGIMDSNAGANKCMDIIVANNLVEGGGTDAAARGGIKFGKNSPERVSILGNTVKNWDPANGNKHGIQSSAINSVIDDNTVYNVGDAGIKVGGDYTVVGGNSVKLAGQAGAGNRAGIELAAGDGMLVTGNVIEDSWNGIRVISGTGNTVKNNRMNNIGGFIFTDAGTDTILATIHCQLTQAVAGAALKDGSWANPSGVDVDANTEAAIGSVRLPPEVQQVVRITMCGWSNVIEAANNMLLNVYVCGASSSEQWCTVTIDIGNVPSQETGGIIVNDMIHWIVDATDDVNIGNLVAGDFLHCAAVGDAADAPDIATDAVFGDCIIEYV